MKTYKITWESLSPYRTELQSDTIFGHMAWALRYQKGASFLMKVIEELKRKPSLVFSSAFPIGLLPIPAIPCPDRVKRVIPDWISVAKELKDMAYVSRDYLETVNYHFDWETILNDRSRLHKSPTEKTLIFGNYINRISGTTTEDMASLYAAETFFQDNQTLLESYLKADSDLITRKDIQQACQYIADYGFGKDKSTGKGRFKLSISDFEEKPIADSNAFLNLSNMVPCPSDSTRAVYTGFTKFGKLGGSFALWDSPFKYPIYIIKPGAVFWDTSPHGSLLDNVHPSSKDENIVQNLYSYSIPIRVGEEK